MKKSICLALSFILLCVSISVTPILAMEKNNIKSNSPSPSIDIQSTVPILGPIAGAKKSGSLQYRSTHQNIKNIQDGVWFLATISGVPEATVFTDLAAQLLINNTKNQYYTRQQYVSGEFFYYKYTFYAKSNYTKPLGSTYSYLYSTMY
nr:hypothetical protein [uncultured bacterium]